MKTQLLYITIVMLFFSGLVNAQTTISINPSQDNTLFEDATGSISDGAGDHFYVGKTNGGAIRRGLLKFDIASNIPSGAIILNVSLSLTMDKTISGASNVELHNLVNDWGEGASISNGGGTTAETNDATWLNTFYPSSTWTTPGGDFKSSFSASTSVNGTGVYMWSSAQMKADVQNWLSIPSANYGWCLVGDESTYPTAKRFVSKESTNSTAIPVLTVIYTQNAVYVNPIKDNTLFEDANGSLSNGAGDHFFVGKTNSNSRRRGLLKFDIASSIPAGATITSVSLSLTMDQTVSGASNVELHKALADWGEGGSFSSGGGAPAQSNDATWLHRFYPNALWATAGGDFSATVSASTSVSAVGAYTWSSNQMITDVQNWLNNPGLNYGWCVKGNEATTQTAKRFATKEYQDMASWPTLLITFTPQVCVNTYSSFNITASNTYTSPSGAVYTISKIISDTIPNAQGCDSIITINLTITPSKTLKIHAVLQGFNQGSGMMSQALEYNSNIDDFVPKFSNVQMVDTLSVSIRSLLAPDYNVLKEYHGLSLDIDGSIQDLIVPANLNASYYLVINHRNSIETWSDPVSFSGTITNYNFYTHPVSSSFAGNMMDTYMNGVYNGSLIWAGDVNQDGIINIFDLSEVYDKINDPNGPIGYIIDDINGDGVINIFDLSIVFDNLNLGAGTINPFTF